jgi:hypothetical protein
LPSLRPFKFLVQAIVIEEDDAGEVLGERPGQVLTIYGVQQLAEWAANFESSLADAEIRDESLNGSTKARVG